MEELVANEKSDYEHIKNCLMIAKELESLAVDSERRNTDFEDIANITGYLSIVRVSYHREKNRE